MKPTNFLFALSLVLASSLATHAQVGIGTSTPNASAALDITSINNDKGLLPPRMTTTQRDQIGSPAFGLVIFNTTTNCLNFYGGLWIEACGSGGYPSGAVFCASGATAVVDVLNPITNKIWMDRNLGATQAATSSTDTLSYGSLYQWGRRADGHQCRYSATTITLSSIDQPADGNFILAPNVPYDWRSGQNANLWQGVNGVNNPCPSGYRLPTETELNAERSSWSPNTSIGALASPLKLPLAGLRDRGGGSLQDVGTFGYYWSSTVSGAYSRYLYFLSSNAGMGDDGRASGSSVRCLKE